MSKEIATLFVFTSDSSPGRTYQTLLYVDGSTSCECKGWIFRRRSAGNGERTCKHTRYVDCGMANVHAVKMVEYSSVTVAPRMAQRAMPRPMLEQDELRAPIRRRVFDLEEVAA